MTGPLLTARRSISNTGDDTNQQNCQLFAAIFYWGKELLAKIKRVNKVNKMKNTKLIKM